MSVSATSSEFKKILFILLCFFSVTQFQAQKDSTQQVHDIIYMKDGRVFKGEILSFNENNGTIIFKDKDGSKYTFTQKEYERYRENVVYDLKKPFELRPRKESGLEIHVGFTASMQNMNASITPDDYFTEQSFGFGGTPLGVKAGAGVYLNRQNFIGGSLEFGFNDYPKNFVSVGARYFYQYDGYKRNVTFYLPVEIHFTSMEYTSNITASDTNFLDNAGSWSYPSYIDYKSKFTTVSLSVGQGFSFIMNNKKSIGIELSFVKYFVTSTRFEGLKQTPNISYSPNALKLSLLYNI